MKLLDANVLLRYLLQDNLDQALAAKALLDAAIADQDVLFVSEAIVAEVVFVLTSSRLYGVTRIEAARKVATVLGTSVLRITDKQVCLRALEIFAERPFLDFPDALLVAYTESEPGSVVYSFDHDFDRADGVNRVEPVAG